MKLLKRDPTKGYLDSMLWVPKGLVNVDGVKNALTFEFDEEEVHLFNETQHHIIVPRAFWNPMEMKCEVVDCRARKFATTGVQSRVKLDYYPNEKTGKLEPTGKTIQRDSIKAMLKSTGGTLQLGCGKGKTVVALHFLSMLQVPTLIAVDNTQLMHQWQESIKEFLIVPGGVGLIQSSVRDWKKGVVMGTYQTLANWADDMPEEVRRWFGLIIWDEGHHVNAPIFSKSAPLMYGYRLALSATPNRRDGRHVVCRFHVGRVLYKDVTQDLKPEIIFKWTGLTLDEKDPEVLEATTDVNGETHLGKVAVHFGSWRDRLINVVLKEVYEQSKEGRKILVLSNSVDEVLNLMTLWTDGDPKAKLYSDIEVPKTLWPNPKIEPIEMSTEDYKESMRTLTGIEKNLKNNAKEIAREDKIRFHARAAELAKAIEHHRAHLEVMKWKRRFQRDFVGKLLKLHSTAGVFTEIVKPAFRTKMLKERQIIFAIMKYGKEGLDDKDLDTVIMSQPVSDQNTIQQIMGRPSRPKEGKKPRLIILEDNIGPLINQCKTIRKHLRSWPHDEGGPFDYQRVGHPNTRRKPWNQKLSRAFGSS
jgi:superfamily II DNA or RNA helicase